MAFPNLHLMLPDDWSIEPIGDCVWHARHAQPDGWLELICYEVANGIVLMDIDLDCRTLPVTWPGNTSALTLNWCACGRCEVDLAWKGSAVLEAGLMCASTTTAHMFTYPRRPYRGFEYHIAFERIDHKTESLLHNFDVDLPKLGQRLCSSTPVCMIKPAGALMHTVEAITDLMAQDTTASSSLLVATCQLLALLNTIDPSAQRVPSAYLQRSQRDLARRLHSAIEANPNNPGCVSAIAHEVGIGEASLRAYFSRIYGTSPAACAREIVLERAAEMLATSDAPVSDVALASNYSNPSKFSAAFKRQFDVNPIEYRRRKKLEQLEGDDRQS